MIICTVFNLLTRCMCCLSFSTLPWAAPRPFCSAVHISFLSLSFLCSSSAFLCSSSSFWRSSSVFLCYFTRSFSSSCQRIYNRLFCVVLAPCIVPPADVVSTSRIPSRCAPALSNRVGVSHPICRPVLDPFPCVASLHPIRVAAPCLFSLDRQ